MAISIGGTVVIDDERNIVNANDIRVGLVTITGSTGDIETPGTITAGGIDFPLGVAAFSPANGATGVSPDQNIVITFNQFVKKPTTGIGTTANIRLRNSSGIGTVIETIGVSSTSVTINDNGSVVTIVPSSSLPFSTNIFVVVDAGAFSYFGGDSILLDTYNFTIRNSTLGDPVAGGFLICCSSSVCWIVAPNTSEVSRDWYCRNDSNTRAQQVSGCTGWFIPTCGQLQNPGYTCRTYWDSFSAFNYWSDTISSPGFCAWSLNMSNGTLSAGSNIVRLATPQCVRSFRCVTY